MRICHLTSVHPAFDTRIFHKECCSLVRHGYEVSLIAPHDRDENANGVHILGVPGSRGRLKRMVVTAAQVYQRARQVDADLYHFHDPELIPFGLLLCAQGKKVIYDAHEDAPRALLSPGRDYLPIQIRKPMSWLLERLEGNAGKRFSALVAATPAIAGRLQPFQPHTYNVNNYPILDELVAPQKTRWNERSCSVAYVGGIAEVRGIQQMVDAVGYLADDLGVRLQLAGQFSPLALRPKIVELRGWKQVDELGFQDRAQVALLLGTVQAGLVLFHPGPNHMEAQPNKLFEYMSAGIPVLASNFPLWRDLIERYQCGLLVDPLNPKEIASAIEYIITHPLEAEAMGQRGRQAIQTEYNWELESQKLLSLYSDILL